MALNIEKFDPNIKSPGINKATGAYARGDVAGVADWSVVSKNIQDSINEAGKVIAADLQEAKTLTDNLMAAKEDAQLAIDKFGEQNINSFTNATDDILSSVKSDMQTDTDRLTRSRKGFLGIGERDERDESEITFKDLTRRQKKEALDRLNNLKLLKQNVEAPLTNWTTNDPADLNWANIAKNPKAKEFYHHLIVEGGEYEVSFTNEKGEKSSGGYIKYEVDGETKYLSNIELAGAKEMFTGAGELKESVFSVLDENAKLISSDAARFQQDNNIEDFDYEKNINMKVNSVLADKANYEFIFNNLTDPKNREVAYTGSEEQVNEVKNYMYEYISDKVGQERTEKSTIVPEGMTNIGGTNYDQAIIKRAKQYNQVIQSLVADPEGEEYSPENPMPKFDGAFSQVRDGQKETSKNLNQAMETYIGEDKFMGRFWYNFSNQLNGLIDKFNNGDDLTKNEKAVVDAYNNHLGGFDEKVNLRQYIEPSVLEEGTQVNYDRNKKIVTMTLNNGQIENFNLRFPAQRKKFFEKMMEGRNLDALDGGFLIEHFYDQGDIKFDDLDESKPQL
tara:strand:- start:162 stop:1847 length:1686 start_codon:yes stop_codon:yes gene_type:complete